MEIFSLKMTLILPILSTCVKNEIGYCIGVWYKDKPLAVSKNSSSVGRNSGLNLITQTIIYKEKIRRSVQEMHVNALYDKYAI